jgi:plasmid stabilization system protein ParE
VKSYTVLIPGPIEAKILEQARYIAVEGQSPLNAGCWLDRVLSAVESLSTLPKRCPLAIENAFRPYEIRSLNIDGFLVLFTVDEEAKTVLVLNVRHARQLPRPDELLPPR